MYFDPGSGSMIIQVIIAGIAGVGAFLFTCKTSVVTFFKGLFKKNGQKNDKK